MTDGRFTIKTVDRKGPASRHTLNSLPAISTPRAATGSSAALSAHSTDTAVHTPRAPARPVRSGTSYSSIAKLGTQDGGVMRTPNAPPKTKKQAASTTDTKFTYKAPTGTYGKTGMKTKERSKSPSSEAVSATVYFRRTLLTRNLQSSSRTVRNKPLSSPKRIFATLTEKLRTARR